MSITRRDFLNGAALTIAAGLTPAAQLAAQPSRYPPALTGLARPARRLVRGRACARARRPALRCRQRCRSTETLRPRGGRRRHQRACRRRGSTAARSPQARILILDNHDDFGGHAKRNEFTLDGRRIIGYGGSQSLQSPNSLYSPVAKSLLRELGIDIKRFETAFDRELYPSLGLVARDVLRPRGVRPRRAGDRRSGAAPMPTRSRGAATPGRCRSSSPIFRFRRRARRRSSRSIAGATRSAGRQVGRARSSRF